MFKSSLTSETKREKEADRVKQTEWYGLKLSAFKAHHKRDFGIGEDDGGVRVGPGFRVAENIDFHNVANVIGGENFIFM